MTVFDNEQKGSCIGRRIQLHNCGFQAMQNETRHSGAIPADRERTGIEEWVGKTPRESARPERSTRPHRDIHAGASHRRERERSARPRIEGLSAF
jgi:hypothetical protein